jgi:hypothetical protein
LVNGRFMKLRRTLTITSRTSSITNCFVQSIIPEVEPGPGELIEALSVLGMTKDDLTCVYCGASATDWDHLRPLVKNKRPTGYITEIRNLVPACNRCNQSKSGTEWRKWMLGDAKGSPKTRSVPDLKSRIERLERFEAWGNVRPLPLQELGGIEYWDLHWKNLESIEQNMKKAQLHATKLQGAIRFSLKSNKADSVAVPAREGKEMLDAVAETLTHFGNVEDESQP